MKESDVVNWLLNEIETYLTNTTLVSLSTPSKHTDVAETGDPPVYPFVGVQKIASRSQSAGIGSGELHVDSFNMTGNTVDSIDYRRDVTFRVEVIPVTDDDAQLRDDLVDELANRFALIARRQSFPFDMEDLAVEESSPQGRPDAFVRGEGVPVEIDYSRYFTDAVPWATAVKIIQQTGGPEHEYTIQ